MLFLPVAIGIGVGILLPIQTSVNTKLSDRMGSSFGSTLISFIISGIMSLVLVLALNHNLAIGFSALINDPVWVWLSGIFGVICVAGSIVAMPHIGSVQTVIMTVLGMLVTGLVIDHFALFRSMQNPLTPARVIGGIIVLAGVLIVVAMGKKSSQPDHSGENVKSPVLRQWIFRLAAICAGVASACQTAVNGYVGAVLESPFKAALLANIVGIIFLIILILITRSKFHVRNQSGTRFPWWIWLGGIIGTIFMVGNLYLAQTIGTGMAVILTLIGQIAGSLVLDSAGLLGISKKKLTANRIIGLVIMIVGAIIIQNM